MNEAKLKRNIDKFIEELLARTQEELKDWLAGITLTGSYAVDAISLENPNVNILLFVKPEHPADFYLKLGRTLYRLGYSYLDYFNFQPALFPFRFAQPVGNKEVTLSIHIDPFNLAEQDLVIWFGPEKKMKTPFGLPEVVLSGFQSMRKVVWGKDVLGEMKFDLKSEDMVLGIMKDFPLYRLQLTRAPLTYDFSKYPEFLAQEAVEIGKECVYHGVQLYMTDKEIKQRDYVKLFEDKQKLLEFIKKRYPAIEKEAGFMLDAREKFLTVKKDKKKVLAVYETAFILLNIIFFEALKRFQKPMD